RRAGKSGRQQPRRACAAASVQAAQRATWSQMTRLASPQTDDRLSRRARLGGWVTRETTGGALLITAAALALVWANSPIRDTYFRGVQTGTATTRRHASPTTG